VDYAIYERLHILFEAPNFTLANDPVYKDFRRKYIRKHGILPSRYAQIGYFFLHFVGRELQRNGVYFQIVMSQESDAPGPGHDRYDFRSARDNQRVPFVSFDSGELMPADH